MKTKLKQFFIADKNKSVSIPLLVALAIVVAAYFGGQALSRLFVG